MIKKICPVCQKEMIQLKHSSYCECGTRILTHSKKEEAKA